MKTRASILALATLTTLSLSALAPTSASAWGMHGGGHFGGGYGGGFAHPMGGYHPSFGYVHPAYNTYNTHPFYRPFYRPIYRPVYTPSYVQHPVFAPSYHQTPVYAPVQPVSVERPVYVERPTYTVAQPVAVQAPAPCNCETPVQQAYVPPPPPAPICQGAEQQGYSPVPQNNAPQDRPAAYAARDLQK